MGFSPLFEPGKCFDTAAGFAYRAFLRNGNMPGVALVHTKGIANAPGEEGKSICHAWIKLGELAFDPIWGVFGYHRKMLKELRVSFAVEYNLALAYEIGTVFDYAGPWDKTLIEAMHDKEWIAQHIESKRLPWPWERYVGEQIHY